MDRKLKTTRRPVSDLNSLMKRMKKNEAAPVKEFRRAIAGEEVERRTDDLEELRRHEPDPLASYRAQQHSLFADRQFPTNDTGE